MRTVSLASSQCDADAWCKRALTRTLFAAVGVPDAGEGAETEHRRPEEQPPPRVRTAPLVRQHPLRGNTEDEAQDEGEFIEVEGMRFRIGVRIMR